MPSKLTDRLAGVPGALLVVAAVQNALKASREMMQAEMQKVTGGMGLPGLGM